MANQNKQLQLLHELQYSDLDMPYQAAGTHTNKESPAFDKRQHMQLVLAKNGAPTPEDVFRWQTNSFLGSPTIEDAIDLFPFLIRRSGANIDKWIHNLHTSIQDGELRNDFMLALRGIRT